MADFGDPAGLDPGTVETWIGQNFVADGPDGPVQLVLTSVTDHAGPDAPDGFRSFSVEFQGPTDAPLPQGTVPVAGDGAAAPLFLVPIAEQDGIRVYEAVFSHMPLA